MSVSTTIPPTFQIGRGRLVGLMGLAAAGAAAVTFAALAFGGDNSGGQAQANVQPEPIVVSSPIPMSGYLDGITSTPSVVVQPPAALSPAGPDTRTAIMSFSPAELSAGARAGSGLTRESVLASLSPTSRHYVEAVTSLTFEQLAAGGAGSP